MNILNITSESNNAVNWFSENKMIVIPDNFKSITVHKNLVLYQQTHFMIRNNKADIESSVKLLGISIDN